MLFSLRNSRIERPVLYNSSHFRGGFRGEGGLGGSHPPFEGEKIIIEINSEYYGRNEGKHSRQVPQCYFYFVALLVFVVERF